MTKGFFGNLRLLEVVSGGRRTANPRLQKCRCNMTKESQQKFQIGEQGCLPSAIGYLVLTKAGGQVEARGYTQEQAWWNDSMTHQVFSFPEFIALVLEGRQIIASLQEENAKLREENASLREANRKRGGRVWYPIRNGRQLRATLRKMQCRRGEK